MPKGPYRAYRRAMVVDALPGLPRPPTTRLTHDSLVTAAGPRESLWCVAHSLTKRLNKNGNWTLGAMKRCQKWGASR